MKGTVLFLLNVLLSLYAWVMGIVMVVNVW